MNTNGKFRGCPPVKQSQSGDPNLGRSQSVESSGLSSVLPFGTSFGTSCERLRVAAPVWEESYPGLFHPNPNPDANSDPNPDANSDPNPNCNPNPNPYPNLRRVIRGYSTKRVLSYRT